MTARKCELDIHDARRILGPIRVHFVRNKVNPERGGYWTLDQRRAHKNTIIQEAWKRLAKLKARGHERG